MCEWTGLLGCRFEGLNAKKRASASRFSMLNCFLACLCLQPLYQGARFPIIGLAYLRFTGELCAKTTAAEPLIVLAWHAGAGGGVQHFPSRPPGGATAGHPSAPGLSWRRNTELCSKSTTTPRRANYHLNTSCFSTFLLCFGLLPFSPSLAKKRRFFQEHSVGFSAGSPNIVLLFSFLGRFSSTSSSEKSGHFYSAPATQPSSLSTLCRLRRGEASCGIRISNLQHRLPGFH